MPTQSTTEKKATEIHQALAGAGYQGVGFDPASIIAIIKKIIALFTGCALTPAQAEKRAANPRLLDRLVLRRVINQNSQGDSDAMHAALLDAGQDLTSADVKMMYAESP